MKILSLLVLCAASFSAWSFPDMTRHGYVHCTACHTTLTGGNLLNEYGRQLSRELLSQTSIAGIKTQEGDERFLYGFAKPPAWLTLGGDIRVLQTFIESKQASRGRFFIMQFDVDASAQLGSHWRAFASLGRIFPKTTETKGKDYVSSPRHGIEYLFTNPEAADRLTLRAGRFMPAYGIGFAEHTFVTRRFLKMGPGQERYAAELAWNNDYTSVIATGILARADGEAGHGGTSVRGGNALAAEKGGAIQVATQVREKSKLGFNYYQTQRVETFAPAATPVNYAFRSYGMFAHMTFNKDWYGLLEIDRPEGANQKWGVAEIVKLGYEIHQGLNAMVIQEHANTDTSNTANPKFDAYSLGMQWFPRPHWDLYGMWRYERDQALSSDFQNVVWLVGHFYL